mmetsp:Transcript_10332/g.29958  ORF Transcript_10332/g.29958 Transcript_10332/m.29958 type:complete len:209 (-) Transcript_10332:39-665(-)
MAPGPMQPATTAGHATSFEGGSLALRAHRLGRGLRHQSATSGSLPARPSPRAAETTAPRPQGSALADAPSSARPHKGKEARVRRRRSWWASRRCSPRCRPSAARPDHVRIGTGRCFGTCPADGTCTTSACRTAPWRATRPARAQSCTADPRTAPQHACDRASSSANPALRATPPHRGRRRKPSLSGSGPPSSRCRASSCEAAGRSLGR